MGIGGVGREVNGEASDRRIPADWGIRDPFLHGQVLSLFRGTWNARGNRAIYVE